MTMTTVTESLINVSPTAASKIAELLAEENKQESGLRLDAALIRSARLRMPDMSGMIPHLPSSTDQVESGVA